MKYQIFRSKAIGAILLAACLSCSAEILQGVFPLDDLKDIKLKYPNGQFQRINAAWVTPDQAFIQLSGRGFPGELFLAFFDERAKAKKYVADKCVDTSTLPVDPLCQLHKWVASRSDEDALTIDWVRWVPAQGIPFERYRSKYGEPTKVDFDNNTMIPFAYWDAAELRANLSDDKKLVLSVETAFTRSEIRQAWLRKHGWVPDALKDPQPATPGIGKPKPPKSQ